MKKLYLNKDNWKETETNCYKHRRRTYIKLLIKGNTAEIIDTRKKPYKQLKQGILIW